MRVTRFMSKDEWDALREGRILLNETDHFNSGKGGSNSKGFCFTEDTPDEAWKYLKGIVDADVCVVFEFPKGHLKESYGVYADQREGAEFFDKMLKREWCCQTYHSSIAKVIEVKDPFQGADYRELKKKIEEMKKLFNYDKRRSEKNAANY